MAPYLPRWFNLTLLQARAQALLGVRVVTLPDLPPGLRAFRVPRTVVPNWADHPDGQSWRMSPRQLAALARPLPRARPCRPALLHTEGLVGTMYTRWGPVCAQYRGCRTAVRATQALPAPVAAAVRRAVGFLDAGGNWTAVHIWTHCGWDAGTAAAVAAILRQRGIPRGSRVYTASYQPEASRLAALREAYEVLDLAAVWRQTGAAGVEGLEFGAGELKGQLPHRDGSLSANALINFHIAAAAPVAFCHNMGMSSWCGFLEQFRAMRRRATHLFTDELKGGCAPKGDVTCAPRLANGTYAAEWLQSYVPPIEVPKAC